MVSLPSTVGPSISVAGDPLQERRPIFPTQQYGDDHITPKGTGAGSSRTMEPRRVHYEDDTPRHSHPLTETRLTYNQVTRTPSTSSVTTVAQSGSEIPIRSPNVMPDGGGPIREPPHIKRNPWTSLLQVTTYIIENIPILCDLCQDSLA